MDNLLDIIFTFGFRTSEDPEEKLDLWLGMEKSGLTFSAGSHHNPHEENRKENSMESK